MGLLTGFMDNLMSGKSPLGNTRQKDRRQKTTPMQDVPQFKRGGKVRKTGLARLHKGERGLTKKQASRYRTRSRKGRSKRAR